MDIFSLFGKKTNKHKTAVKETKSKMREKYNKEHENAAKRTQKKLNERAKIMKELTEAHADFAPGSTGDANNGLAKMAIKMAENLKHLKERAKYIESSYHRGRSRSNFSENNLQDAYDVLKRMKMWLDAAKDLGDPKEVAEAEEAVKNHEIYLEKLEIIMEANKEYKNKLNKKAKEERLAYIENVKKGVYNDSDSDSDSENEYSGGGSRKNRRKTSSRAKKTRRN
jgi:hypothetical protein